MKRFTFDDFAAQGQEIQALQRQIAEKKLVHALLITGEPGTGKRSLAMLVAASLLCSSVEEFPCGICPACQMTYSGEHPDLTLITKGVPLSGDTKKGRSTIPVEDIREMIRICSQYAYEGGNRVVIVSDAENMTIQAQNCLLKILEEPPRNTYILLTSSHPEQILTTVRSRCRQVKLKPWDRRFIQNVLINEGIDADKAKAASSAASGSIGQAFVLASDDSYWKTREEVIRAFFLNIHRSDILPFSNAWKDRRGDADMLFAILEDMLRNVTIYRLDIDRNTIPDEFPDEWREILANVPIGRIAYLEDQVRESRKQNAFNVNFQAIIEQLLLAFTGETEKWQR